MESNQRVLRCEGFPKSSCSSAGTLGARCPCCSGSPCSLQHSALAFSSCPTCSMALCIVSNSQTKAGPHPVILCWVSHLPTAPAVGVPDSYLAQVRTTQCSGIALLFSLCESPESKYMRSTSLPCTLAFRAAVIALHSWGE